jgi:cation diffusion facilitator family transporter
MDALDPSDAGAHREKRLVALSSVLAAVVLTGLKVAVGLGTGSLGILSEAAHSALDLVAAVVTLWAVRMSSRPADQTHPYGHGKFENLSALFETALLLATCVWIVYEAAERLFFRSVPVEATPAAFAVMGISILVDVSRSRALQRVARKYGSQALEADALHFSTDIWSSAVVIVGLGLVRASERLGMPWLARADAGAALAVAAIVVWVSLRLGKKSIDDLVDAVPDGLAEKVVRAALVPGVLDVRGVRIRRSGAEVFADVNVLVSRGASLERAHELADAAEASIREAVPGADAVIHIEPVAAGNEGSLAAIRVAAARHGLGAHAIRLHRGPARAVDLHLEVPDALTLREAAALVHLFEEDVRRDLPHLGSIAIHTEPVGDGSAEHRSVDEDARAVAAVVEALAVAHGGGRPDGIEVRRLDGGLSVAFRWRMPPDLPVLVGRARAVELEKALRARIPSVARVLVRLHPDEAAGGAAASPSVAGPLGVPPARD